MYYINEFKVSKQMLEEYPAYVVESKKGLFINLFKKMTDEHFEMFLNKPVIEFKTINPESEEYKNSPDAEVSKLRNEELIKYRLRIAI